MNALQQGLDAKPALPQGFPAGRPITTPGQIAAHLRDSFPESLARHPRGRLSGLRCNNGEQVSLQNFLSGPLRLPTRQVAQLQQADGQWRQEAQQADQAVSTLHLASFEAASRFETLVIILYDPAVFIPPNALPGLLKRRGGHRGQQNPFQGLLSGWGLLFPHPHGPNGQRLFATAFDLREAATRSAPHRQVAPPSSELCVRDWRAPATGDWRWQARLAPHRANGSACPLLAGAVGSQRLAPENGSGSLGRPGKRET